MPWENTAGRNGKAPAWQGPEQWSRCVPLLDGARGARRGGGKVRAWC